jgi:hypothetical protein
VIDAAGAAAATTLPGAEVRALLADRSALMDREVSVSGGGCSRAERGVSGGGEKGQ